MTVYLGLETPIWQVRGPRGLMPRVAAGGREAIRINLDFHDAVCARPSALRHCSSAGIEILYTHASLGKHDDKDKSGPRHQRPNLS